MTEKYAYLDPVFMLATATALDGLLNFILDNPMPYEGPDVKFKVGNVPKRSAPVSCQS